MAAQGFSVQDHQPKPAPRRAIATLAGRAALLIVALLGIHPGARRGCLARVDPQAGRKAAGLAHASTLR
jgi:hypothetical protein